MSSGVLAGDASLDFSNFFPTFSNSFPRGANTVLCLRGQAIYRNLKSFLGTLRFKHMSIPLKVHQLYFLINFMLSTFASHYGAQHLKFEAFRLGPHRPTGARDVTLKQSFLSPSAMSKKLCSRFRKRVLHWGTCPQYNEVG